MSSLERYENMITRVFEKRVDEIDEELYDLKDTRVDKHLNNIIQALNADGYDMLMDLLSWYVGANRVTSDDIEDVVISYCEGFVYGMFYEEGEELIAWKRSAKNIDTLMQQQEDENKSRSRRNDSRRTDRDYDDRSRSRRDTQPSRPRSRRSDRNDIARPTRTKQTDPEDDYMNKNEHATANPEDYNLRDRKGKGIGERMAHHKRAAAEPSVEEAELKMTVSNGPPPIKVLLDNKLESQTGGLPMDIEWGIMGDLALNSTTPTLMYSSKMVYIPLNCDATAAEDIELGFSMTDDADNAVDSILSYGETGLTAALGGIISAFMLGLLDNKYGLVDNNGWPWLTNRNACIQYLEDNGIRDECEQALYAFLGPLFKSVQCLSIHIEPPQTVQKAMLSFVIHTPTIVLPWATAYLYNSRLLVVAGVNPLTINDIFDQAFKILGKNYYSVRVVDTGLTEYTCYKQGDLSSPSIYSIQRV